MKDDFIHCRISTADKILLQEMAKEQGLCMSKYIIYLLKMEKKGIFKEN